MSHLLYSKQVLSQQDHYHSLRTWIANNYHLESGIKFWYALGNSVQLQKWFVKGLNMQHQRTGPLKAEEGYVLQWAHIHKYRHLTGSERCPNWDCTSGCYYLHTEAHWENVWKLLLIMLSVTNQPWPLSPQDTRVQTYGCDDNFWGIYCYKQPFSPLSLVWCVDLYLLQQVLYGRCFVQGPQQAANAVTDMVPMVVSHSMKEAYKQT